MLDSLLVQTIMFQDGNWGHMQQHLKFIVKRMQNRLDLSQTKKKNNVVSK